MADEENPLTSTTLNDPFVFIPTVATIVILLMALYGLATLTAELVNWAVTPLAGLAWWAVVAVLTVVYVAGALLLIYRDNGIEVPLPTF